MTLSEYFAEERGRQAALAKAIGVHAPDLSKWASGDRPIPEKYGAPIEAATKGAVTRKELFPDCWQSMWPELAEADDLEQLREAKGSMDRLSPNIGKEMT